MANPYTSLVAGPKFAGSEQDYSKLNAQVLGLDRQRKMAELLLLQGLKGQPDGQMISGYYVPPSWTQRLNPVLNRLMGEQQLKDVDEQTIKLAEQLRKRDEEQATNVLDQMFGREAMSEQMAGPYGMGVGQDGANVPMPTLDIPAVPQNLRGAFRSAALSQSPQARALLPVIAEELKPKEFKPTNEMQNYLFAKTPEGGGFKGTFNDFKNQMTSYQASQLDLDRQKLEMDKIKNLAKPLPEGLNKQVTGAVNLNDAISDYQAKIKNFGVKEFANPNKRAEMGNAYNNMMLQAKEAYNLGVLNGPDYDILQKVVRDPTNVSSLAFANNALSKQADSLRKTASDIVRNAYLSQGRDVPTDISAKFVKKEEPKSEKSTVKEQLGLSTSAIDAELQRRGLK